MTDSDCPFLAISIRLSIIRQRRAWILRGLTHKCPPERERSQGLLIDELREALAGYTITKTAPPGRAHSIP